jgi:hypothetical protein
MRCAFDDTSGKGWSGCKCTDTHAGCQRKDEGENRSLHIGMGVVVCERGGSINECDRTVFDV